MIFTSMIFFFLALVFDVLCPVVLLYTIWLLGKERTLVKHYRSWAWTNYRLLCKEQGNTPNEQPAWIHPDERVSDDDPFLDMV